ncbi:hypothetical protein OXB_0332 [Bacillus sp. OxB-1]|nr:hypothetical protein OXB_0332 [Bacillus sp. OxB-1]
MMENRRGVCALRFFTWELAGVPGTATIRKDREWCLYLAPYIPSVPRPAHKSAPAP